MDNTPVLKELLDFVNKHPSQKAAAREIVKPDGKPISEAYLSDLLHKRRDIPEWLAYRFHYVPRWVKVKK